MPVVLPQFTAAWPAALTDFVWGVRRFAYLIITAALGCGLGAYLLTKVHPPRVEASAIVRVTDPADSLGLERLLRQRDFLARVARQARLDQGAASAAALERAVEIRVRQFQNQVEISVLAADPDLAADVANAVVQGWLELSSAGKQVLSGAQPPDRRFSDQAEVVALAALAAGLALGALLAGLNELLRATFRAPGDISACLPVMELGAIPDCRPAKDPGVQESLITTAYRSLLQSLWSTGKSGRRPRVLVVASPRHGDGRSTVAANLALAFADTHRWVLLIDGNTRRPEVHQTFSVSNQWGLSDALRDDTAIDLYDFPRLFKRSAVPGLWVLPAGTSALDLTSDCARDRLSDLLARARLEFHNVIVDTAPGPRPEVRGLARSADGVLLVVRASKTSRRSALELTRLFARNGIGVVGAVLNDWRPGEA
jgi:Mrp family chromosome partitioning ATPase